MSTDLITKIVEAILTIPLALVSAYVIPWLKTKIGQDKMDQLNDFIELAVRAAEQLYTPEEWQQKKAYVLDLAEAKILQLGLGLTEDQLDAIIEGIVNAVKHNVPEVDE